jgi:hypothetical protein
MDIPAPKKAAALMMSAPSIAIVILLGELNLFIAGRTEDEKRPVSSVWGLIQRLLSVRQIFLFTPRK